MFYQYDANIFRERTIFALLKIKIDILLFGEWSVFSHKKSTP